MSVEINSMSLLSWAWVISVTDNIIAHFLIGEIDPL